MISPVAAATVVSVPIGGGFFCLIQYKKTIKNIDRFQVALAPTCMTQLE